MRSITVLLALISFVAIGEVVLARHSNSLEWEQYKQQHGKVYTTAEEDAQRFSLFLAAKDKVRQHNANPAASHKLGLNHLSDWTPTEFAKLNGLLYNATEHQMRLKASEKDAFIQSILNDPSPLPTEVDWRKVANRVSPVKYQGQCGSCWAFASTGVLEGQQVVLRNISGGVTSLSEQDLIDCSESNQGCNGGNMLLAFQDIATIGGIDSEQDYPYRAMDGECKFNKKKVAMTDVDGVDLPQGEEALKKFVARYGPVSIGMIADYIESYKSGIFSSPDCVGQLNHGVLVVGYGTDAKMGDYWIVKNSWGAKWGEEGFFRIKRGGEMCGIGTMAIVAKVTK